MGPRDGLVYQCLRDQIGAAIKGLAVWQRLLQEVEKRQSAERLYERMASLGRLTAGIAHGMNTPVAAVRAALQHLSSLVEEYRSGVGDAALTPADHQEVAREMAVSIKAAKQAPPPGLRNSCEAFDCRPVKGHRWKRACSTR